MKTIGQRIHERRIQLGMSADELAEKLDKNRATIYRYEGGEIENLPVSIISSLANALAVSPGYLMGWEESPVKEPPTPHPDLIPITQTYRMKLLGPVAAGEPIQASPDESDYIDLPYPPEEKADACLLVKGDSMKPKYLDGDVVFVRYQDDVDDGQIAAICIDDTVALKRVYHIPHGVCLVSENSEKYPPMNFTTDDANNIHLVGLAVGFMRWEG